MTSLRFDYQRLKTAQHIAKGEKVLNVGSWDDPGHLGQLGAINCDIQPMPGVEVLMNALEPWPFANDEAGLVVIGDMLEHHSATEIVTILAEARRVAKHLVVTCPEETRPDALVDPDTTSPPRDHCITLTFELLGQLLQQAGWQWGEWQQVNYEFVPNGHFVYAERA